MTTPTVSSFSTPFPLPEIHPTAVVHPEAQLGPGVKIGAYTIIEGPAQIGAGCIVHPHAVITGWVRMGERNTIGYGAVIGSEPQDHAFNSATESWVVLGNDNRIREHVTIHRGTGANTETRVGNHCFLMVGAHVGHNSRIDDRAILANNVLLGGHVHIGAGCFLGGGSVYHQMVRVGRLAMVQGNASMSKDVPPFLTATGLNLVAGLNIIGLRRAGLSPTQRKEVKDAFKLIYKSGLNTQQALEAAKEQTWGTEATEFLDFVATAKKRGFCALLHGNKGTQGKTETAESDTAE